MAGLTRQERARREAVIAAEVAPRDVPRAMGTLRRVELPGARELTELFGTVRRCDTSEGVRRGPGEYYCSARPHGSWYVTPTARVREVLAGMSQDLGISFKVVMRDSGTALVCADYDRIIGGRWIAVVDGAKVRTLARKVGS